MGAGGAGLSNPFVTSGTPKLRSAYIIIGIHAVKYNATYQFVRGTFLTHLVIMSWISGTGQHLRTFKSTTATYESGLGLVIWNHMAGNPLSAYFRMGCREVGLPSLVDGQECDISSRESVATSSPDSTTNAPIVPDNPGGGFGGRELLVENVIELGNPTLVAHEVTHSIWLVINALHQTR